MKVLNLDKLAAKEQRFLAVGGVRHRVHEMTVSNFIETTQAAERIADAPLAEQIQASIDLVIRTVPTVSREELTAMPLETLQAVVAFVRGDEVEGVESQEAEGDPQKK